MPRRSATRSTLKTLFALSRNVCALPGCEAKLTDPAWREVFGEVAHIHAESPGGPRWNPALSEAQRWAFDNLLVLCPGCHKRVDRTEPERYPADVLREIKQQHEARSADARSWASDEELNRVVAAVMHALSLPKADMTGAVLYALGDDDQAGRALMRSTMTVDVIDALAGFPPGSTFAVGDVADSANLDRDLFYEEMRRLLKAGLVTHEGRGRWTIAHHPFWKSI